MAEIYNQRKNYIKATLLEEKTPSLPMELFQKWYLDAVKTEIGSEANAMNLSTIGLDGFPKNRIVLLKNFTHKGLEFYTNYKSEKGNAIATNPHVCLSFFWEKSERQVIIKGIAKKVNKNISDSYFESRPKQSCLVALVSNQSAVIPSREFIENKLDKAKKEHGNNSVKRPEYWGGFLVSPISVEFWQGGAYRLHDRIRYVFMEKDNWKKERLAP